jgi:hypothetical protein
MEAKTWLTREPGPECRVCKTKIERGHRYYQEENGVVVHYSCKEREE